MNIIDRFIQKLRFKAAQVWIPPGSIILDIGCHQGEFFTHLGDLIGPSTGIDPLVSASSVGRHSLIAERYSRPLPLPTARFDVVTLLATMEHVQDKGLIADECHRLLRSGGRVIITVPSPRVDALLLLLRSLRVVHGMSLEEHHGFNPYDVLRIFERRGFTVEHHRKFEICFNNLFVFSKSIN